MSARDTASITLRSTGKDRWRVLLDGRPTDLEVQYGGRTVGYRLYSRAWDPTRGWSVGPLSTGGENRADCLEHAARHLGVSP